MVKEPPLTFTCLPATEKEVIEKRGSLAPKKKFAEVFPIAYPKSPLAFEIIVSY